MKHSMKFAAVLPLNDFASARSRAALAEETGFYAIAAEDHFFMTGLMGHDRTAPRLECFTMLAALAPLTKRVVLTQIVAANSFRHPALLAKIITTLQHISGGRTELGLGAGWFREEYDAFDIPYPAPAVRIDQMRESLELIKKLWSEPTVDYQGEHYKITNAPH